MELKKYISLLSQKRLQVAKIAVFACFCLLLLAFGT
jgi:hypothetical protein